MPTPRGFRTAALAAVVLAVIGVSGILMHRAGVFQRWFARDSENPEEVAQLRKAPPAPPTEAAGASWPQFLGPNRDGHAPAGPFRTDWDRRPPQQLWTAPLGGGYSSFAVVGGKLYTQDRHGDTERLVCLDAETSKQLWEYAYPADYAGIGYAAGPRATPTVDGGRVFALGAAGLVLCVEPPAGPGDELRLAWKLDLPKEFDGRPPQWGYAGSPLVDGGLLVVQPGGRKGAVAALDKTTGQPRWAAGKGPPGYSSPVASTIHGVPLVFAFTGDALLCVRADGIVMGSYPWPTAHEGNIATPLVMDDYVFITSGYGMGCALLRVKPDGDRVRLEPVYAKRNKPIRCHHSTPVLIGRHLYGFDGDNDAARLVCFSLLDGAAVDGWEAPGVRNGKLIAVGDYLVILTQTGDLILVQATPEEYRPVATVPLGFTGSDNWASPVLVDGRLYVRGPDKVVCLDVRP